MPPLEGHNWHGLEWPEQDVLDLQTTTKAGAEIRLRAYRWPPANGERRAVVFFVHGYGSHMEYMAISAQYLAAAGYEVFSMDMRGHGDSGGEKGIFDSHEQVYDD